MIIIINVNTDLAPIIILSNQIKWRFVDKTNSSVMSSKGLCPWFQLKEEKLTQTNPLTATTAHTYLSFVVTNT